ncbi:hypothetical protein [Methylovirgula sp. HY1]|uniref:hypothetical protein n=1 Tax=Methylovirgula sp. HY1 TaxID=2822761 RepID=UPI001C5B99B7|nr:hypothetical protein [Methylovirgula sp. HY1]
MDFIFASIDYPIHFARKQSNLQAMADALNENDDARAWFTMTYMRLPRLPDEAMRLRLVDAETLLKASANDPKHPGWPSGTPGGLGGKFRPKTSSGAPSATKAPRALERVARKAARRVIRGRLIAHLKEASKLKDEFDDKIDALDRDSLLLDDIGQMVVQAQEIKVENRGRLEFCPSRAASLGSADGCGKRRRVFRLRRFSEMRGRGPARKALRPCRRRLSVSSHRRSRHQRRCNSDKPAAEHGQHHPHSDSAPRRDFRRLRALRTDRAKHELTPMAERTILSNAI